MRGWPISFAIASAVIVFPVPGGPANSRLSPFFLRTTLSRPHRRNRRVLLRISRIASWIASWVCGERTTSLRANRGLTRWYSDPRSETGGPSSASRSSSDSYTSTPPLPRRTTPPRSSLLTCAQDFATRPHFGHFTIHWSRSLSLKRSPRERRALGSSHADYATGGLN